MGAQPCKNSMETRASKISMEAQPCRKSMETRACKISMETLPFKINDIAPASAAILGAECMRERTLSPVPLPAAPCSPSHHSNHRCRHTCRCSSACEKFATSRPHASLAASLSDASLAGTPGSRPACTSENCKAHGTAAAPAGRPARLKSAWRMRQRWQRQGCMAHGAPAAAAGSHAARASMGSRRDVWRMGQRQQRQG
eukprot:356374-Chlamydomonas_euryale.AAC.4